MKGILLVNLGSPDSPEVGDVKRYLSEFLMDERVIDIPYLLRYLLVKGIIVNTRSKKSAAAYQKIWTKEGSPLIVNSQKLSDKLQVQLNAPVTLAMRYGSMSIEQGITELVSKGVDEILLIPLYPQYAMSTTETVMEKAQQIIRQKYPSIKLAVLPPFYENEGYLNALATHIKSEMKTDVGFFLFSYHGLPERHIKKADITKGHCKIDGSCCSTTSPAHEFCYRHHSYKITEAIATRLGLEENQYITSFQSRLGRDPWLQPYTDATLIDLAKKGHKDIQVIAPSFVSDCLETLEEMAIENQDNFIDAGGESYHYISCLNDDPVWVDELGKWCNDWLSGKEINYKELK